MSRFVRKAALLLLKKHI